MKKNYLISTGGSGGHVIPATILYEHFSDETNVIISTDKRGLKYFNKSNYRFKVIDTPKLNRIFIFPLNFVKIIFLIIKSFLFLRNNNIEKVFSTGGYMSLPLIIAAKFLRLKIYLLEPNLVLGRANKFYLNSCYKIFCYTNKIKNFPEKFKNKMIIINPLVRKNIYKFDQSERGEEKFTLLIIGGSQGANIFDKDLKDYLINISKKKSFRIIQQTSEKNVSYLSEFYSKNNVENKIFSFDCNFANTIKNVDLCITRAGASTLSELSVINIPFIAVPLPSSKDNHQYENAHYYENNGCCWVIEQRYFSEKIEGLLEDILTNKTDFFRKKENLKKLNYQNTWINVNQKILSVINEN